MIRRLLALPLALLLLAAAPPGPRPALWKVSDPDTTLWLFGTIHALPADYKWTTPAIDAAVASSDALVLETVLADDPNQTAALLYSLAQTPGLPPLAERIDAAGRPALKALTAKTPLGGAALDGLETWAAALILSQTSLQTLKLGGGVEDALKARFANKPVIGLETPAQQLGFLDQLPEAEQRKFLASTLEDDSDAGNEYDAMLAGWAAGDEALIARSFDDEASVSPYLKQVLLTRRNQAWASWLEARLRQPGSAFVAVGAGHLAGTGSVVSLLEAKGYRVERVQ